ncbi:MAG: hypothetical protein K5756_08925 [Clostridiales bacterium]|nr:hypothetical protein [Clostridiales bacterium]
MKHIFVINPAAGKGRAALNIQDEIKEYCEKEKLDYVIHVTRSKEESISYIRDLAKTGEHIRFYSCGGDGTLFCAINACFGYKNTEIAVLPLGSGNDFVRILGKKEDLLNVEVQVKGTPTEFDVIKCGDKIAISQCSMGLDAEVCAKQAEFKKIPFFSGEFAYTASLLYCVMKKVNNVFTVAVDDDPPVTKKVLFALCGNSKWYGGGYKGAPLAKPDDGLLDCIVVEKNCGRLGLLKLIGPYKEGKHLEWKNTVFKRGKKFTVHSDKPAAVNVDGECEYVTDSTFEIVEKAVNIVIPSNSSYFEDRRSGKI